jgi:CheY-like chemotaxis protein
MEILSLDTPQTILVIEDKLSFAYRLIAWLEGKGHSVYGYSGVSRIEANILTGINPLSDSMSEEVDLSKIEICFLDHYFEGRAFTGTTLTKILAPAGIKVCGMSSVDEANQSMMRVGAVCAYQKDKLARMLNS